MVSVSVTTQKVQTGVIPLRKQVHNILSSTSFCIHVWSYDKPAGFTPGPQNLSLWWGGGGGGQGGFQKQEPKLYLTFI